MIFRVVRKVKGKKMSQNDKVLSVAPYISGIIHHMIFIFGTHMYSIFLFFQNLDSWGLSHSTSQELYIIWLWFSVHMSKMMISPVFFFIFWKFWFLGVSRSKRAKNDLKLLISVCHTLCLRNCRYHQDFWYADVK